MKSSSQGQVAPIGQGRDDKTSTVTKILIAVGELSIHRSYKQAIVHPVVPGRREEEEESWSET